MPRPLFTPSLRHFSPHPYLTCTPFLFIVLRRASPLQLHSNNIQILSPLSTLQRTNDLRAFLRLLQDLLCQRILIRALPFSPWYMTTDDSTSKLQWRWIDDHSTTLGENHCDTFFSCFRPTFFSDHPLGFLLRMIPVNSLCAEELKRNCEVVEEHVFVRGRVPLLRGPTCLVLS